MAAATRDGAVGFRIAGREKGLDLEEAGAWAHPPTIFALGPRDVAGSVEVEEVAVVAGPWRREGSDSGLD